MAAAVSEEPTPATREGVRRWVWIAPVVILVAVAVGEDVALWVLDAGARKAIADHADLQLSESRLPPWLRELLTALEQLRDSVRSETAGALSADDINAFDRETDFSPHEATPEERAALERLELVYRRYDDDLRDPETWESWAAGTASGLQGGLYADPVAPEIDLCVFLWGVSGSRAIWASRFEDPEAVRACRDTCAAALHGVDESATPLAALVLIERARLLSSWCQLVRFTRPTAESILPEPIGVSIPELIRSAARGQRAIVVEYLRRTEREDFTSRWNRVEVRRQLVRHLRGTVLVADGADDWESADLAERYRALVVADEGADPLAEHSIEWGANLEYLPQILERDGTLDVLPRLDLSERALPILVEAHTTGAAEVPAPFRVGILGDGTPVLYDASMDSAPEFDRADHPVLWLGGSAKWGSYFVLPEGFRERVGDGE